MFAAPSNFDVWELSEALVEHHARVRCADHELLIGNTACFVLFINLLFVVQPTGPSSKML